MYHYHLLLHSTGNVRKQEKLCLQIAIIPVSDRRGYQNTSVGITFPRKVSSYTAKDSSEICEGVVDKLMVYSESDENIR